MRDLVPTLPKFPLESKIITGFGVAVVTVIVVGALQYEALRGLIATDRWVAGTTEFLRQLEGAISDVKDAESTGRGYVATGDAELMRPLDLAISDIHGHLQELQKLAADDPSRRRNLERLAPLIDRKVAFMQGLIATRREKGPDAAVALLRQGEGVRLMDEIRELGTAVEAEEDRRIKDRRAESLAGAREVNWVIAFGVVLAVAFLVVPYGMIRRDFTERKRTERVKSAAFRISELANSAQNLEDFFRSTHEVVNELMPAKNF